ncbi:MAG: Tfp pilus assembly protein FimT [Gammaproteobacteria bacterium]|jgi:Tfp pilus assembly protein FimT
MTKSSPTSLRCPTCNGPIASARGKCAHCGARLVPKAKGASAGNGKHAKNARGSGPGGLLTRKSPRDPHRRFKVAGGLLGLGIFGVMSALAIPGLRTMSANHRAATQVNHIVSTLLLARATATEKSQVVRLCPRPETTAQSTPGNERCDVQSMRWEMGWITYIDADRDHQLAVDAPRCKGGPTKSAGDCIIAVAAPFKGPNTLRGSGQLATQVAYLPNGRSEVRGKFSLCAPQDDIPARVLAISVTGRVGTPKKVARQTCLKGQFSGGASS